jgi:hypothetical protein
MNYLSWKGNKFYKFFNSQNSGSDKVFFEMVLRQH